MLHKQTACVDRVGSRKNAVRLDRVGRAEAMDSSPGRGIPSWPLGLTEERSSSTPVTSSSPLSRLEQKRGLVRL